MKLLTRVKPKPVATTISAVRRFPPSLAPANISGVPQHPITISRPSAREFVSPFPGSSSVCSSNNTDTRGRDEDVGLWSWANPSDSYNHSHNHIRQREDGHRGRDPRLAIKIEYLIGVSAEDPVMVSHVCRRASATEVNAKEATNALCRLFKYSDISRQLSAISLWAVMLGNASELFIHQCEKRTFMETVEGVLYSEHTSLIVREHLLEVVAAAAYASFEIWHENESAFRVLWRKVKPAGMPDVGVPFGPGHAIFKHRSSQRSLDMSRTPRDTPVHPQSHQAEGPRHTDSKPHAMHLQHENDEGALAPSVQRNEVEMSGLECAICMDEMPADLMARIDSCGHAFCRDCLRGHVSARLDERKFPILCPTCACGTIKGKGKGKVGEVSHILAQTLGLTDKQHKIWTEMEMAPFSILLRCRRCKRSMFVARDDHEEVKIIVCPLPDCRYTWCKACQQPIDFSGPKHSCDGTAELDSLMKRNGWKYCPTCKTPIQKRGGCNHMKCAAPACNTHFCYLCGELIVKSTVAGKISEAVSGHFAKNCGRF